NPLWLDQLMTLAPNPATWPRGRISCTGSHPTSSDEPDPDAYVLFTSGSTGLPKGARIGITNLKSYINAIISRLRLTADDTWLQVASLGFDVVIEEVFPVLFARGAVAIRPDSHDHDPATLQRDLHQSRATVVELSTSYWYEYQRWLHAEHV